MWLLLEKRWLPRLSSFFSLLPILSLFDLKSDFFFVCFIFFAFFPEALVASQTSIAWRKHRLHLIVNIITLNGTIWKAVLSRRVFGLLWLLPDDEFFFGLDICHHQLVHPTSSNFVLLGSISVIHRTCDVAVASPASFNEIQNGSFASGVIHRVHVFVEVNVQSWQNQIPNINNRPITRYGFLKFVEVIILHTFWVHHHEAFASTKPKGAFGVQEAADRVVLSLLVVSWNRRVMAHLLGYEAEVFGYHFESFSKMWVEWLLDSIFAHIELRDVVADG